MEFQDKAGQMHRGELTNTLYYGSMRNSAQFTESTLTWEQAVRVLRKNQRFLILVSAILILTVVAGTLLLKNVYQPKARINVDPLSSGIRTLHEIEEAGTPDNPDYLETQAQILQGQGLAIGVIRALRLDRNPEFVTESEITKWGGKDNVSSINSLGISKDSFLQDQLDLANRTPLESIALAHFEKELSVTPIRNSRLIEVSFASHDPQMAQDITNTLVTQFIEQNYRNRYTTTMEASAWLSKQLDDLRKKVEASNQAVSDYQRKYNLVETDEKDVPLGQLMSDVNHQYSEAEANRIEIEAYVRMINQGNADSIPAIRDDQLYQTLMSRLMDVRAQLAQARTVYGDENSNVKKLEGEVREFTEQLTAERVRILDRLHLSYEAARDRERMMLNSREKLRSQMGDASSRMVAYRVLKNEASAEAELYNTLQGRLKEAGIYAGLRSSNIRVVELASRLQKPTSPHRGTMIAIGSILSCFLAIAMAFVRESMDNTARTPDDMRDWIGKPALAMLPSMKSDSSLFPMLTSSAVPASTSAEGLSPARLLQSRAQSAGAEAIRDLRTALLFSNPVGAPRVILISSPSAGEGKTTVAINLAMALSSNGRTCLIDGDLRQPKAAQAMGVDSKTGLTEVLSRTVPLTKAVVSLPDLPLVSVLPAGTPVANPGDLMDGEQMQEVVNALIQDFAYIVIDSPPLIPFADARLLASVSDAVVLVGRYGITTRRSLTRCASILDQVHAPIAGVVLNDIDLRSADYHYYNYGFSSNKNSSAESYYNNSTGVLRTNVIGNNQPPPNDQVRKKGAGA